MRSLRLRLLAVVAFVSIAAVVTVVLLSREVVRSEFDRFETSTRAVQFRDAAEAVRTWVDASGDTKGIEEVLRRFDRPGRPPLALVDSTGGVVSWSSPSLGDIEIQVDSLRDQLQILRVKLDGQRRLVERTLVRGAAKEIIANPAGHPVFLYQVPVAAPGGGPAAPYVRSVNRWMIGAVAAAAALAMLVTWILSKRIVGPVEALTAAARRMERGDLDARVRVASNDEIGDLSHAFNAMADALERNEALRRRLVSDVAHELRTPLTNLRAQLEAIEDGIAPADAASLASLQEETLLLARLIDDLQELTLAEAARLRLERSAMTPRELLERAAAAFRAQAEGAGVALIIEAGDLPGAPDVPDVWADGRRVAQILRNLIANALTHTPRGGTVTLRAARGGAAAKRGEDSTPSEFVRFEVRDTGVGIAPEHLPHVFERFYRADPSRSRATGGAGVGLSIAKHLVEAHGEAITIESALGAGTSVTFTLPVAPPAAA